MVTCRHRLPIRVCERFLGTVLPGPVATQGLVLTELLQWTAQRRNRNVVSPVRQFGLYFRDCLRLFKEALIDQLLNVDLRATMLLLRSAPWRVPLPPGRNMTP